MKAADLVEPSLAVECVEVMYVARGELARLQITASQVCIAKFLRILAREKMKAQPAPVHAGNTLRLSEERDKQKQNKIGIHLRLQLQVAGKIFGSDLADSVLELKCCMQRMIQFFHEHDQRSDIAIAHAGAWIVLFELLDEPTRIINANVELVSRTPKKCARELAQFTRSPSRQDRQLRATHAIDQAIFQIDSDLRVGPLK